MPIIRYFVVMGAIIGGLIWSAGAFVISPPTEKTSTVPASQRLLDEQAAELVRQKTATIYHVPVDAQTLVPARIAAADDQGSRKAAAKISKAPNINSREKKRTRTAVTRRQRQDGTQVVEQGNPATRTLLEF